MTGNPHYRAPAMRSAPRAGANVRTWWIAQLSGLTTSLMPVMRLKLLLAASYYGITVTTDVDELVKVPQFTLNWGESPQEVIDRVARWSALLYYDQPDGNLLLTRVGTRRAASGIAEGVNVEQAYYRKSMADRFSDYVGVSMSVSPIAGYSPDTAYDAVTLATARDPEAARMRYRKHISIVESTLMATQQAQSAIDWEMNRRYGRSKQLSVTIDSGGIKAGNCGNQTH